jgi:hypothetical protein
MKKDRRDQLNRLLRIGAVCFLAALCPCGCCLFPFIPKKLVHERPVMLGAREGAQGRITQKITCESSYRTIGPFPGPHGFFTERVYAHKYFLEETGKPRRELRFLDVNRSNVFRCECWPVDKSPVWVLAGDDVTPPQVEHKLLVVVFDQTRVLHRRTLKYKPDMNLRGPQFSFENGNRTLLYSTDHGLEAYDVLADKVTRWNQPEN